MHTVHPTMVNKPLSFCKDEQLKIKRMQLDNPTNTATVSLRNTTKASFDVAWKNSSIKKSTQHR